MDEILAMPTTDKESIIEILSYFLIALALFESNNGTAGSVPNQRGIWNCESRTFGPNKLRYSVNTRTITVRFKVNYESNLWP